MNCDNLDCLARPEPETPCWEIAKRVKAFHSVSNTCKDCVVKLLNEETSVLSTKQRELLRNSGTDHQGCILKAYTTG